MVDNVDLPTAVGNNHYDIVLQADQIGNLAADDLCDEGNRWLLLDRLPLSSVRITKTFRALSLAHSCQSLH